MKLTKNADPEKYGYSGYCIGLDVRSQFSLPSGGWGKNVNFGVENSLWLCVLVMSHTRFTMKSTLCSCLKVRELLAQNRCDI